MHHKFSGGKTHQYTRKITEQCIIHTHKHKNTQTHTLSVNTLIMTDHPFEK